MRICFLLFALLFAPACLAGAGDVPAPVPSAADRYEAFIDEMISPQNLTDCIARMDELIDAGEQPTPGQNAPHTVTADTKLGLHMEFSVEKSRAAVIYYLFFSRQGKELKFPDAAKMIALFGDRAGLPHPIIIDEGEKPVFYARWLIKPSEWDAMRKMMLKVRTENRAEKDPQKALLVAALRELKARQAAEQKAEGH